MSIFTIEKATNGNVLFIEPAHSPFYRAWDSIDSMRAAGFKNCFIACAGGFENAIVFVDKTGE